MDPGPLVSLLMHGLLIRPRTLALDVTGAVAPEAHDLSTLVSCQTWWKTLTCSSELLHCHGESPDAVLKRAENRCGAALISLRWRWSLDMEGIRGVRVKSGVHLKS